MRVLIAAGGTAGHINPALAIAGEIAARCPQAQVHFAGRKKGMEYGLASSGGSRQKIQFETQWRCIIWRSAPRAPPRF